MTERDTHFAGFARLLIRELGREAIKPGQDWANLQGAHQLERIIARRAYDLAVHVLANDWAYPTEAIYTIPDLTEWPESPNSE